MIGKGRHDRRGLCEYVKSGPYMHTGMFFNVIVDERLGLQHRLYHLRGSHGGNSARTQCLSGCLQQFQFQFILLSTNKIIGLQQRT